MTDQPVMVDQGRAPRLVAPPGACETRSHVYGPREQYPHHPGRGPDEAVRRPILADSPARLCGFGPVLGNGG